MIDEIRVDGALFEVGAPLLGVVDLEVSCAGILFPSARSVTFQYRLDGYDSRWVEAGNQRVARYTNIPPGPYRFQLRARSSDGVWTQTPFVQEFDIDPRWYQRRVVIVFGLVALVSLTVLVLRRRTRAILARSRALEKEIERRRRVETELRASRAEHLAVLEAAQGGIFSVDAGGAIA